MIVRLGKQNTLVLVALAATVSMLAVACGPSAGQPGYAMQRAQPGPSAPLGQNSVTLTPIEHGRPAQTSAAAPAAPVAPPPVGDTAAVPAPRAGQDLCANSRGPNTPDPDGVTCAKCTEGEFIQRDAGRNKLDILIVADTSPSLNSTRRDIAKGVKEFIKKLPAETDYHIAILPAHSDIDLPAQDAPRPGRHSSRQGGKVLERVLTSGDYRRSRNPMDDLGTELERRLFTMQTDSATDGGEAGLYSLYLAATKFADDNKRKGIFRENVTLAVIFISDENDLCAENYYPEAANSLIHNGEPVSATDGMPIELAAHKFYCEGGSGQPAVTPASTFAALRALKTDPKSLLLSAIVYHPSELPGFPAGNPVPERRGTVRQEPYWNEKEAGHGYIDIVQAAREAGSGAQLADLAATNDRLGRGETPYGPGLAQIGQSASLLLMEQTKYPLREGLSVDPNALCLSVDSPNGRSFEIERRESFPDSPSENRGLSYIYNPATREIELRGVGTVNASGGQMRVRVTYCESPDHYAMLRNDQRLPQDLEATRGAHYSAIQPLFSTRACGATTRRLQQAAGR